MELPNPIPGIYPCSVVSVTGDTKIDHTAFVVRAVSHDEAVGKAQRIAEVLYPMARLRDTVVNPQCYIQEPELAKLVKK